MAEVMIEEMIVEVRRELRMREQVYGKVKPMPAINVRRIEVMQAVLKTLEEIAPVLRKQGDILDALGHSRPAAES